MFLHPSLHLSVHSSSHSSSIQCSQNEDWCSTHTCLARVVLLRLQVKRQQSRMSRSNPDTLNRLSIRHTLLLFSSFLFSSSSLSLSTLLLAFTFYTPTPLSQSVLLTFLRHIWSLSPFLFFFLSQSLTSELVHPVFAVEEHSQALFHL